VLTPPPTNSASRSRRAARGRAITGRPCRCRAGSCSISSGFSQVKEIGHGRVVAEPGAIIAKIDKRDEGGFEPGDAHPPLDLRHRLDRRLRRRRLGRRRLDPLGRPARHGQHHPPQGRDDGGEPRILELTGDDIHKVSHAYGTNGIITEVEMPLTPAYDWVDVILGFDDPAEALQFANDLWRARTGSWSSWSRLRGAHRAGLFQRVAPEVPAPDKHVVMIMVAPICDRRLMPPSSRAIQGRGDALRRTRCRRTGDARSRRLRICLEPHDASGAEATTRRSPICRWVTAMPIRSRWSRGCGRTSRRKCCSISR
jgi:hypothetical protein